MQREQKALDTALEKQLIREARDRTQAYRQQRAAYRAEMKTIQTGYRTEKQAMKAMLRDDWSSRRTGMTKRHKGEREALSKDHGKITARVLRVIDVTGQTRKRQDTERRDMQARHRTDRSQLVASHRDLKVRSTAQLDSRHEIMRREVKAIHAPELSRMADRNKQAETEADRQRQMRAAERERAEQKTDQTIARAEQLYRSMQRDRSRDRGFDRGR